MAAPYQINVWHDTVGETLRVLLYPFDAMETVLDDTAEDFVPYVMADIDDYGFSLAPVEAGSLMMVGNPPAWLQTGRYYARVFVETAGVITESSRVLEEGPTIYNGTSFTPITQIQGTYTYTPSDEATEYQGGVIVRGSTLKIRFTPPTPTAIDITKFEGRLQYGSSRKAYHVYNSVLGNLTGDAVSGDIDIDPTSTETDELPLDRDIRCELWRTDIECRVGIVIFRVDDSLRGAP